VKRHFLLLICIFIFLGFITGCGDDNGTTIIVPTTTTAPTSTPVITTTPVPTSVPTVTPTPTPGGNQDLSNEFDFMSAVGTAGMAVRGLELTAEQSSYDKETLKIRLRQKASSTLKITDIELSALDNPGFPCYNGIAGGGPAGWETLSSASLFAWTGETQLTPGTTYDFYIIYRSVVKFPSKMKLIVTGGDNHSKLGYIEIAIVAPRIDDIPQVTPIPYVWQYTGDTEVETDRVHLEAGALSAADLETFLTIPGDTLSGGTLNGTYGSAMGMTVKGRMGRYLVANWEFQAQDYLPYDDFAFATVVNVDTGDYYFEVLARVSDVGDYGNGSGTFSYKYPATGTYRVGFGVMNAIDNANDSELYIYTPVNVNSSSP